MQKVSENTKKTRRLNKEETKKQLIDPIVNNDISETQELNEKADKIEKPEDVAAVIKQYKDITVNSLISGHHRGNDFCLLIGDVRLLESLTVLIFCCLGRGSSKVLS